MKHIFFNDGLEEIKLLFYDLNYSIELAPKYKFKPSAIIRFIIKIIKFLSGLNLFTFRDILK